MSSKTLANFISQDFENNSIFDLYHPMNRDNCFQPYFLIREKFKQHGYEINTSDLNGVHLSVFGLHMDANQPVVLGENYLLMLETPQVCPANDIPLNLDRYRKVFTWNDDLVDGERFIKINFPNPIHTHAADGFRCRNYFCCLIAGNKTLTVQDERDLYPERVNVIRWFEKNAPNDFDLYGIGWDIPVVRRGDIGKIERLIWQIYGKFKKSRPFSSYRGEVSKKSGVLTKTRYTICYENVRDLPGYITEKIFDSFFSGCVPVYWGASNITDYVPEDCFIDRRKFNDNAEVYTFLKNITEQEFMGYQQRIAEFLMSEASYQFSSEFFAETIVNTIVKDLDSES